MLKRDLTLKLSTQARAPGFRVELHGTTFRLIASGAWTVAEATQIDAALKRLRVPIPPTPEFTGEMDIAGIAEIDTAGAMLLQRTAASWSAGGLRTRYSGATEAFRILIEEVKSRSGAERPKIETRAPLKQFVDDGTKAITGVGTDALLLTNFLGEVTFALGRMIKEPWRFRMTSFVHPLDHAGLRAVPIIAMICLLIGAVVMQQGVVQLKPFGAEPFAVNMVAILALREVGILLTAIMVAGRWSKMVYPQSLLFIALLLIMPCIGFAFGRWVRAKRFQNECRPLIDRLEQVLATMQEPTESDRI